MESPLCIDIPFVGTCKQSYIDVHIDSTLKNAEFSTKVFNERLSKKSILDIFESKKMSKSQMIQIRLRRINLILADSTALSVIGPIAFLVEKSERVIRLMNGTYYFETLVHWRDEYEDEN